VIAFPGTVDLGTSFDRFVDAAETFFARLADIGWGYLAGALLLYLVLQLCRAHGWANALRAAYPRQRVSEAGMAAAFLAGAGANAILPARAGDAVKIVLAKRSVARSSYAAMFSSLVVLAPFDAAIGVATVIYAIANGLLPQAPRIPHLPAFEISYWFAHPGALLLVLTMLGIGVIALFALAARRAESLWAHLKQGLAILREPGRYLREVAAWQLGGWICRFAAFWLFLDAFHIGGSVEKVLLVMSVQSITGALPFTPGGAGAEQALLVATLSGASRTAVLAYSVGQQIAITAWSLATAVLSLLLVFRTHDWRRLVREGEAARAAAGVE
jgi:uncharacterized membrane protein YbhN (UPF0104 family)